MSEFLPRTLIPVPKIEEDCYDWYKRHEMKLAAVREKQYDLVFIGDSITHFFIGEDGPHTGEKVWQKYIAPWHALNLGCGFDRTQNVLWRLDHDELKGQNPKMFVVNIGTNQFSITEKYSGDTSEVAAQGVIGVIQKLRTMFPDAYIVVMAVFPRGPKGMPMRDKISGLNRIVKQFTDSEKNCEFLDLSSSFTFPDGELRTELFGDGSTHPNEAGYQIWADALAPILKQKLSR